MQQLQKQDITKELDAIRKPRIFVDNDALAFFDVAKPNSEPTDISEIKDLPIKDKYGQSYNFLVEQYEIHYFSTVGYDGIINTLSVTSPCIVFCAYAHNEDGRMKSSGVLHAAALPGTDSFEKMFSNLIETVRGENGRPVMVKGVGSASKKDDPKYWLNDRNDEIMNALQALMIKTRGTTRLESLSLGGKPYRVSEFYPQSTQLITYFRDDPRKTII